MPSQSEALATYSAVVVTGGSSGIGKTFIERVHRLNPGMCFGNLSRRRPEINLPQLNLRHFACDLADAAAISATVAAVLNWLQREVPTGKILLINNSGFGGYGRVGELAAGHQLEMIDVNVRAVVDVTTALLPALRERGGTVVTIASTAAFQPTPFLSTYGATKAFVLHWTLGLHEDLRGSGVTALAVCPGPTSTDFFRRAGLKQGSVSDSLGQTSEQVVDEALTALASGRMLVVTGWKNKLLTAVTGRLPKAFAARIGARVLARYRMSRAEGSA